MANRVSNRIPQILRFVIDSAANVTPVTYTAPDNMEIIEAWVVASVAVANNTTIANAGVTVAVIASAATIGDTDYAAAIATADITKRYVAAGAALTVQTSDANARSEVYISVLPGVTATN
jgi:hypothetical protein